MLGKLMKYDIKAVFRQMMPLYAALLAMSVFMGLSLRFRFDTGTIFTILTIIYFITVFLCFIVPIILLAMHFKKNLLEDEGYLMFALPATTLELILSKLFSALLSIIICMLFMALSIGTVSLIAANIDDLRNFLEALQYMFRFEIDMETVKGIIKVICLLGLSMLESITHIYASISIGHLFSEHQTIFAVIAFVAISVIISYLLPHTAVYDGMLSTPLYLETVLLTILFTAITWLVLDRRLNLR